MTDPLTAAELVEIEEDPRMVHLYDARRIVATVRARDSEIAWLKTDLRAERERIGALRAVRASGQASRVDWKWEGSHFVAHAGEFSLSADNAGGWTVSIEDAILAGERGREDGNAEAAKAACIAAARELLAEALRELGGE